MKSLTYMMILCTLPCLTLGMDIRKMMKVEIDTDDAAIAVKTQEKDAKKISTDLNSLKLNKIPHRIYLAGNEIMEGFDEQLSKNHVEMKFTYELVEPKLCQMFNPPFGCCWDNRTVALGPNSEGCPVCKNKKKSCRKWKDQCSSQIIKDTCPETCNICQHKARIMKPNREILRPSGQMISQTTSVRTTAQASGRCLILVLFWESWQTSSS